MFVHVFSGKVKRQFTSQLQESRLQKDLEITILKKKISKNLSFYVLE